MGKPPERGLTEGSSMPLSKEREAGAYAHVCVFVCVILRKTEG